MCGWDIDILTEDQESERRQKEFQERTNLFMEALDVDELLSQLLVTEGFNDINELHLLILKKFLISLALMKILLRRSKQELLIF